MAKKTKTVLEHLGEITVQDVCPKSAATICMQLLQFRADVEKMRNLQKAYYANKTTANLQAALAQEKYVDELLNQA